MPLNYDHNVFINCPFDQAYAPLLQAMVFTVVDCGFHPRCALEKSDSGEVRIEKIYRIIKECGLSVHDLSRTHLDPITALPRFNMPLEFGIFLGAKFLGVPEQQRKMCLVFDEQPYRYQMYLSDVAGQDIKWHRNDARTLVLHVRDWFTTVVDAHLPSGSIIWDHYLTFQGELRHNCEELKQRPVELTYIDILRHVVAFRTAYKEKLDIKGDRQIRNPSDWQIKEAIKSISPPDPYIILEKGSNGLTYIQALQVSGDLWSLEFQDGHIEQHFISSERVGTDRVIEIFLAFSRSDDGWRKLVNWTTLKL
jgi:hypothetical protein